MTWAFPGQGVPRMASLCRHRQGTWLVQLSSGSSCSFFLQLSCEERLSIEAREVMANVSFNTDGLRRPAAAQLGAASRRSTLR